MAMHHKRLLVGIAVGVAVSAVAIGATAIKSRTSNAGSVSAESEADKEESGAAETPEDISKPKSPPKPRRTEAAAKSDPSLSVFIPSERLDT